MTSTKQHISQPLFACIRVPKSGSKSLSALVSQAFVGRSQFYLPDTWRPEVRVSRWQAFRLWRSQVQNLRSKLGVWSLDQAFVRIEGMAAGGDVIVGGHFDHGTVARGLKRPVKSIVLLRNPAERLLSEYVYARAGHARKKSWQRFDSHRLAQAAGRYDFDGFIDFQLDAPQVYGDIAAGYVGWTGDASFASVRESIWCWGVLEKTDAFASDLSARIGRRLELPRTNVTPGKPEQLITMSQRRRIETLFARDYELYERCCAEAGQTG